MGRIPDKDRLLADVEKNPAELSGFRSIIESQSATIAVQDQKGGCLDDSTQLGLR